MGLERHGETAEHGGGHAGANLLQLMEQHALEKDAAAHAAPAPPLLGRYRCAETSSKDQDVVQIMQGPAFSSMIRQRESPTYRVHLTSSKLVQHQEKIQKNNDAGCITC